MKMKNIIIIFMVTVLTLLSMTTIAIATSLNKWNEYNSKDKIKINSNGRLYYKNDYGEGYFDVDNVDAIPPEIELSVRDITENSFTLDADVKDVPSGISTVTWRMRKKGEEYYTNCYIDIYHEMYTEVSEDDQAETSLTASKKYNNLTSGIYVK